MKATKQKNSHARSKQRRRALRLKNFNARVVSNRLSKRQRELKPKGKTFRKSVRPDGIMVTAKMVAMYDPSPSLFDHNHAKTLNQRQKRKRARQQPHGRKK